MARNCWNFWLTAAITLFIGLMLGGISYAQIIQYSENFTNGVGYSPGDQQYDNWMSFRAALGGGADSITISGSNDATGRSCTVPATATQIANALSTGTALTIACDGNTWRVGTCGTGIELNAGTANICSCAAGSYTVRPTLFAGNRNCGGVNTAICNGPTQTMTVTVADTTPPTIAINAPTTHEAATFEVTFQFSESVTGFDISDITVTNGSASGFTVVDTDTYTVTITPTGALDITVSVAAGSAQDIPGNLLSNSDSATIFYLPTTGGGYGRQVFRRLHTRGRVFARFGPVRQLAGISGRAYRYIYLNHHQRDKRRDRQKLFCTGNRNPDCQCPQFRHHIDGSV